MIWAKKLEQENRRAIFLPNGKKMRVLGFEPKTYALKVRCSTI